MNDDTLTRLDTALRLLAVASQDLRNLRALMTQPEPEELGKWVNTTGITPMEERVLDFLAIGTVDCFADVGEAAEVVKELFSEPLEGRRDTRKSNAKRVVMALITKGYLYEHDDGTLDFGMT
jgi:hypothetical protein